MVQLGPDGVTPTRAAKLIVLDRDGVINYDSDLFIKTPEEWRPIPGSVEAIARLNHAGYRVVVATNQSGIGRGLFDMGMLNTIHEKMYKALAQAGGRLDAQHRMHHHDHDDADALGIVDPVDPLGGGQGARTGCAVAAHDVPFRSSCAPS